MDALTIHEAAETTGWSARMLRYVEQLGLVVPRRSGSGYRLYGPEELQRLRTLRELLEKSGIGLAEVGWSWAASLVGISLCSYLSSQYCEPHDVPLLLGSFGASAVLVYALASVGLNGCYRCPVETATAPDARLL